MKIPALLATALVCALSVATAAETFEGTVAMKMTDQAGKAGTMNFSIKGGLARVDIVDPGTRESVSMITDSSKQEVTMLIPQNNMYMTMPIPQQAPGNASAAQPQGTFEKTSTTEKILGYDTVKYISKSGNTTTEIWMTEELGSFPSLSTPGRGGRGGPMAGPRGMEWADALRGKPMFPLRVVSKSADGREVGRMEATAVDKKALAAALFAPPAGWQDLSAMMRGALQGMPGGMMPGGMPGMPGRGN